MRVDEMNAKHEQLKLELGTLQRQAKQEQHAPQQQLAKKDPQLEGRDGQQQKLASSSEGAQGLSRSARRSKLKQHIKEAIATHAQPHLKRAARDSTLRSPACSCSSWLQGRWRGPSQKQRGGKSGSRGGKSGGRGGNSGGGKEHRGREQRSHLEPEIATANMHEGKMCG
jgi:hypothetical protein